jgi:DNA-binding GntR family transcriptional regulator
VRDMIVHGRLAPGSWIVETDLTARLGLSRTPVRGALQLLEREGYVVEQKSRTKSRVLVAPLTKEDARELYLIVGHIEGLAARETAALPKAKRMEVVSRIREINARLDRIAKAHKTGEESIFDLDMEFHRIIVEASAGPRLLTLHNSVKPQTERYWRIYASTILEYLHVPVSEHEAIISALTKGDADLTEKAVIENWVNGAERLCKVIELYGERGIW